MFRWKRIGIFLNLAFFIVVALEESIGSVKNVIGDVHTDGSIAVTAQLRNETILAHPRLLMVMNDDYCDNIRTGEDETNTSACSFFSSQPSFVCTKDGITPIHLPTSRIQDGICDCCDGRDEINTPFPITCTNTCEQSLATLRKQALITYRNIQAGRRKKTELLQKWKQRKFQETKNYQEMHQELKSLTTLITRMKFYLHYELEREDLLRWQLIREREHHCAAGFPDSCDYFQSEFVNEDELMYEGYPLAFAPINKKRRFVWEYTKEELEYLQRVKGTLKVKAMLCPQKHLLPDDNARIFTKLSDYLDFMEAPYGYAQLIEKNKVNPKKMQERSYFAQFLEKGERGYIMAAVVWWEIIGLLLSPVTVPLQVLYYGYESSLVWLWQQCEQWEQRYHQYLLTYYREEYQSYVHTGNKHHEVGSLNEHREEEDEAEAKVLPKLSSVSVSFQLHYFMKSGISLLLDTNREGTIMFQLLDYFDIERYPVLDYLRGRYYRIMSLPMWIYNIVMNAPWIYFQVYFQGKYDLLPPRRNACLLREGIATAEKELATIQTEIYHYEEMKALLIQQKVDYLLEKEAQQLQREQEERSRLLNKKNSRNKMKKHSGSINVMSTFFGSIYNRFFTRSREQVKILKPKLSTPPLFSLQGLLQALWSSFSFSSSRSSNTATTSTSSNELTSSSSTGNLYYDQLQRLYLDYGEQNEWESIYHSCINHISGKEEEYIHHHQEYQYSFCFFQEIFQDSQKFISLGKFSHWGSDLFDYQHQQYPQFYPLLQKYLTLATHQERDGSQTISRHDFKIHHLINIYDIQDAILQRHEYQPSYHYYYHQQYYQQLYTYFFQNNTFFQSLTSQWSSEEKNKVIDFFQQFYLFGNSSSSSGSSSGSSMIGKTGMTSQGMQSHQQLKTAMLNFYSKYFPRINSLNPMIYTNPSDDKEELLQEQLHLYYSQQVYEYGTDCPVKPGTSRKTMVYFDCGAEQMISEVKEYEVCLYEMRVVTPLICNEFLEKKALQQLEDLGVFGFAKKN